MIKLFIQNRKGQRVSVVIEDIQSQKGLAFVMHGLGGYKEQEHIRTMIQAFLDNHYSVVSFDTTNTFGESDGSFEAATVTNYFEDLEDVIEWSKSQSWYQEPFCLVGHSLGGICTALYAEKYPHLVKALAPIATVVSGKLSLEKENEMKEWKEKGYREKVSRTKPGLKGNLPWSHMEDRLKYDLLPQAHLLTIPMLMIVGSEDVSTPPQDQEILFKALAGPKEFHLIEGANHGFNGKNGENYFLQLYEYFNNWVKTI